MERLDLDESLAEIRRNIMFMPMDEHPMSGYRTAADYAEQVVILVERVREDLEIEVEDGTATPECALLYTALSFDAWGLRARLMHHAPRSECLRLWAQVEARLQEARAAL